MTVEDYTDLVQQKLEQVGEHLLRAWLLTLARARFTDGDRVITEDDPVSGAHLVDIAGAVLEDLAPEKVGRVSAPPATLQACLLSEVYACSPCNAEHRVAEGCPRAAAPE